MVQVSDALTAIGACLPWIKERDVDPIDIFALKRGNKRLRNLTDSKGKQEKAAIEFRF